MKRTILFVAALGLLSSLPSPADVDVFRAVDKKNATFAKIADGQWRVDPDGVSTFEDPNFSVPNKQCRVSFTIQGVNSQPAPGTQGQVQNMAAGIVGEYTPASGGTGHWSIKGPAGMVPALLQAAITAYVIANQKAEVNPTYTGSSPSNCQTPAAPNLRSKTAARK